MKKKIAEYIVTGVLVLIGCVLGVFYLRNVILQKQIASKVLRFHVLANSDSEEDQQLKLQVRDRVGAFMQEKLQNVENIEQCEAIVLENMNEIIQTADEVITEDGYHYSVAATLETTDFPAKTYGNYTFPEGEYEALCIEIGNGKGHNWWCVMYPNMCFENTVYEIIDSEAEEELRKVLSEEEYERILASGNYKIRFKYLTFLNKLVNQE